MEKETESKKIAVLTAAGYSVKEISELREDGYDFVERVWLIEHGYTRGDIEKAGTVELMKNEIKVMAEMSWDAQKNGSSSD